MTNVIKRQLLPFLFAGNRTGKMTPSMILYLSGMLIATLFGHYPVPIVGAGMSPVIGYSLMVSFVYIESTQS